MAVANHLHNSSYHNLPWPEAEAMASTGEAIVELVGGQYDEQQAPQQAQEQHGQRAPEQHGWQQPQEQHGWYRDNYRDNYGRGSGSGNWSEDNPGTGKGGGKDKGDPQPPTEPPPRVAEPPPRVRRSSTRSRSPPAPPPQQLARRSRSRSQGVVEIRPTIVQTILDSLERAVQASEHSAQLCRTAAQAFTDQTATLRSSQRLLQESLVQANRRR